MKISTFNAHHWHGTERIQWEFVAIFDGWVLFQFRFWFFLHLDLFFKFIYNLFFVQGIPKRMCFESMTFCTQSLVFTIQQINNFGAILMGNVCRVAIWPRRRRAILGWNEVRFACMTAKILCTIRQILRFSPFSQGNRRHRCSICLCPPRPTADCRVALESRRVVWWPRPLLIRLSLSTRTNSTFYWKNSNHFGPCNPSTVQMWPTEHRYPKPHAEYYLCLFGRKRITVPARKS